MSIGAEAAAHAAAGRDLLRVDRHADAAAAFERALATLGDGGTAAERADLVAALAEARFEIGRFDGVEPRLCEALDALADDPGAARERAALELGLARVAVRERRLGDARRVLEAALARFDPATSPLLAARAEGLLGGVLAIGGEPAAALPRLRAARELLRRPPLDGFVRDAARLSMNIAIACSEIGRHAEAEREIALALDLFDGLVRAGRVEALPELGRARRNHGYILAGQGRHAAAAETLRAGVEAYRQAAATPGAAHDVALWRASRAGTLNSLGFSLFALGELDAAEATLRESLRLFTRVVREQPAQRDEQARAVVNRAHVAAARGDLAAAAALYRRGRVAFEALLAEGRRHHDADLANAGLGTARVALRQGRVAAAVRAFGPALGLLADATREGRLQHARAWLGGWQQQVATWLAMAPSLGARADPMVAALQRALDRPPLRPAGGGAEPLRALADAAAAVAPWAAEAAAGGVRGFEPLASAYLEHLFGWSATLLADSDPAWLREHADEVARCVGALGDAAAARPDAASLLAGWFFGTHGLRAQRQALAQGDDPRLAELRALLQRLHALEAEMLGEGRPDDGPPHGRAAPTVWAAVPSAYADRRGADWRALRERLEALRRPLVAEGVLPGLLHLDAARATGALAADEALLLVARTAPDRARVVALRAAAVGPALQRDVHLDPALAAFPCELLNRLARRTLSAAARGQPLREAAAVAGGEAVDDDGDRFALDLFARWWQQVVRPLHAELLRGGARRFALVPADDLHLVPWNHLAAADVSADAPLRIYPDSGAWWRGRSERPGPAPAPVHWAVAAPEDTAERPLPWAALECRLSMRLWAGAMHRLAFDAQGRVADGEADALLGIGHGGAPDGNPARAGLALGRRVLSAADLAGLPSCRRVLMSACLLGRTEDAQGEGLGFLSACLDRRMAFAAGWLTEVPDFPACLFSLAAQWALREAGAAPWSRVFASLRQALAAGRWPTGFGAWLSTEAAAVSPALADAARAPPALLQRVLPWVVALGD